MKEDLKKGRSWVHILAGDVGQDGEICEVGREEEQEEDRAKDMNIIR